ncbi:MAG: beta-ketoacyl synthase N-terminal-like domain-containing protein [Brevinematales bacterium]
MKREVFISYSNIITGLGNLDETWQAILERKSSILKKKHFENSLLESTGLSLYKRNFVEEKENFAHFLIINCLNNFLEIPKNTYVIWTGIKNSAEFIEKSLYKTRLPQYSSERDLLNWVIDYLGLKEGMEISAACASSTVGISLASQLIAEGKFDNILVIGCDFVTKFVYYGFAALKAMTEEICKPFDKKRKGLSLGDGAFALLLSSEKRSKIRVSGWSITNDANHITGPSRTGDGLADSIKKVLKMSGLKEKEIQAICAHGTGTLYNDAMEIKAFNSIFSENVPITFGIKGSIGHSLGAAGGIEIALSAKCLLEDTILPTVGCDDPEANYISLVPINKKLKNIISCNSGFGGINASVLLEKC